VPVLFVDFPGGKERSPASAGDKGDGGGDDDGMEARVAKLEAAVEHIQSDLVEIKTELRDHRGRFDGLRDRMERDFRILFGAIIAVALALAGLMAKGFHWL
jgi:hypothetical protein